MKLKNKKLFSEIYRQSELMDISNKGKETWISQNEALKRASILRKEEIFIFQ